MRCLYKVSKNITFFMFLNHKLFSTICFMIESICFVLKHIMLIHNHFAGGKNGNFQSLFFHIQFLKNIFSANIEQTQSNEKRSRRGRNMKKRLSFLKSLKNQSNIYFQDIFSHAWWAFLWKHLGITFSIFQLKSESEILRKSSKIEFETLM
jgi:hypothetical protein